MVCRGVDLHLKGSAARITLTFDTVECRRPVVVFTDEYQYRRVPLFPKLVAAPGVIGHGGPKAVADGNGPAPGQAKHDPAAVALPHDENVLAVDKRLGTKKPESRDRVALPVSVCRPHLVALVADHVPQSTWPETVENQCDEAFGNEMTHMHLVSLPDFRIKAAAPVHEHDGRERPTSFRNGQKARRFGVGYGHPLRRCATAASQHGDAPNCGQQHAH